MPTKKPSQTNEIVDKIFGSSETGQALKEFSGTDFSDVEKAGYYILFRGAGFS